MQVSRKKGVNGDPERACNSVVGHLHSVRPQGSNPSREEVSWERKGGGGGNSTALGTGGPQGWQHERRRERRRCCLSVPLAGGRSSRQPLASIRFTFPQASC